MSAHAPCPAVQEYAQLLQGQVPLPQGEHLVQHLEACPRCAESVERLLAADALTAAVRTPPPEAPPADEQVEGLMERLCRMDTTTTSGASAATTPPVVGEPAAET